MKLRDNFPETEEQAKGFEVVLRDSIGVFKMFEIEDTTSLSSLDKTLQNVNHFLENNGYDKISAVDFIKNDFVYESENSEVSLTSHYYTDKLILSIERENYINLRSEIIEFMKSFLQDLKTKTVGYEPARRLDEIITEAKLLPKRPRKNLFVSFEYDHCSYSIAFSDYKIELDSHIKTFEINNKGNKYNFKSYQSHNYYFGFGREAEVKGDFDQFRKELSQALENVTVTKISISEDE